MEFTTDWLLPTRATTDDTVGDSPWVEVDSILTEGDYLAQSFFLTSESYYLAKAHLVFNDVPLYANNEASGTDTYPFANLGGTADTWGSVGLTGADLNNKFGVAVSFGEYDGSYTERSYYLVATGYDLNIPDEATIDGIEVEVVSADNSSGGGTHTLFVDTIKLRVTYTWNPTVEANASSFGGIFVNPPNRTAPYKRFRVKARSEDGDYLGDLRVANEPSYKQDINNLISSLPLELAQNDLTREAAVDELLNEDGSNLTDETDSPFLIDTAPIASIGEGSNLDTNHNIEVDAIYGFFDPLLNEDDTPILNEDGSMILVEEGFPLGRTIFRGYVPRWELPLNGGSITSEVRSYSQDLENIILTTVDTEFHSTGEVDRNNYWGINGSGPSDNSGLAQVITIPSDATISKIRIYPFAGWYSDVEFSLAIYDGNTASSPGNYLGGGSGVVNRNNPVDYYDVPLDTELDLTAGDYIIFFSTPESKTGGNVTYPFNLYTTVADYSGGTLKYATGGGAKGGGTWYNSTDDIALTLFEAGGDTVVPFLSKDPSQILREIVDFARDRGARINYEPNSIEITETIVSYTFNTNTIKEAIEKVLELAPAGWYFYYDFGTDTIYFRESRETPDRYLRKGQSVVDGKIVKTIEQVVNDVLFSGGAEVEGDPNLYIRRTVAPATGTRRGLSKRSDSRVTDEDTAIILADSEIGQYNKALYAGDVEITEDGTYYLEDVAVGETLGFIGFGSLVDAIVVQSVSKDYRPDTMPLTLGYNLPRVNKRVEDIKRNLQQIENDNNPVSPS